MAKPRDTYKYYFKVGNKIVHGGVVKGSNLLLSLTNEGVKSPFDSFDFLTGFQVYF